MRRVHVMLLTMVASAGAAAGAALVPPRAAAQQRTSSGWNLPANAAETKSPLTVDDKVLAIGQDMFPDECQECHGPKGLGDGRDADQGHAEDVNLTNPTRAERNPDGVVFYKVMSGRRSPKMPPNKDDLSAEQIWSVVAYAQSLRKK